MNNIKADKLEKFLEHELSTNKKTIRSSFLRVSNDMHVLFGIYGIKKEKEIYVVFMEHSDKKKTFGNLKTAITWCVFHERNKISECKTIEMLDTRLASINAELIHNKHLIANVKNDDTRAIYHIKADDYAARKSSLLKQLEAFINTSNSWQAKRYESVKSASKR